MEGNTDAGSDSSDMYMGMSSTGSDDQTSSTSYPFYVELDSSEDLMLGQHVYLMADNGQEDQEDGLWLEDYYFITDEDGAVTNYVWAVDANDKLEKREVTLGDFNDETFKYEVLDGLTVDDYIAFPGDDCVEGAPVTRNADDLYDDTGEDDLDDGNWDNDGLDDGSLDENMDWGEEGNLDSLDENFEDAGYGEEVYE